MDGGNPEGHNEINPHGIALIRRIMGADLSLTFYYWTVAVVTFVAYICYHASRKPTSIVKSSLLGKKNSAGWAPFDNKDGLLNGKMLLGILDLAFLSSYAGGMFVTGKLADRYDLRMFLSSGMVCSGFLVVLYGSGYFLNYHDFYFYLAIQIVTGFFQSTGWPSVIAAFGKWHTGLGTGLVFGIWNAHSSVGNILGSFLAVWGLRYNWGCSFIIPGALIILCGVFVFLFLPAAGPQQFGFVPPQPTAQDVEAEIHRTSENTSTGIRLCEAGTSGNMSTGIRLREAGTSGNMSTGIQLREAGTSGTSGNMSTGIRLSEAWFIPGVIPYALCNFFTKLVANTFMYWLPSYIHETGIEGRSVSVSEAGIRSACFDGGGIIGGILAGYISDGFISPASTVCSFLYCSAVAIFAYHRYGSNSQAINIVLIVLAGSLVNGPYTLMTKAVSAELSTHRSLNGNARALATVTGIIDGIGSVGAALGPLVTGCLKDWDAVLCMLIFCALIAGTVVLIHLACNEFRTEENSSGTASAAEPLLTGRGESEGR